jgi:bifunctional DNase/RNase
MATMLRFGYGRGLRLTWLARRGTVDGEARKGVAVQEMRVVALGRDPMAVQPVLLLQEIGGQRRVLPVWVGMPEATAIELARRHVELPRPQTHQLILDVVRAFNRRLQLVRITMLQDSVFHAELVFDGDIRVSARVSDAVAIALHVDVRIEAEDAVLDEAAVAEVGVVSAADDETPAETPSEQEEVEEFRRFLDNASPEDFGGPS